VLSSVSFAGTFGVDFTGWNAGNSVSFWSLGYQFTANTGVTVTGLGAFDFGQDGFAQPQQVGLWDSSGTLLASTFVSNSDPLQGLWRFHPISGVTLTSGANYYVASQGGEGYVFFTNLMVAPQITFIQDAWHYNGDTSNNPLAFPDQTDGFGVSSGGGFFGGNIEFGATPEPGTLVLFGSAVVGLAGIARRKFDL
jgi:hypothetical protein